MKSLNYKLRSMSKYSGCFAAVWQAGH